MKSTLKNESTPGGRTFKVTITETYQRTVTIYESEMKEPTVEEAHPDITLPTEATSTWSGWERDAPML
jgi:hypothetical protein